MQMADLARGGVGVRGTDQLPHPIVSIMADLQHRFTLLEDLPRLDARGAQQPVPHPPGSPVMLHHLVGDPPDERQVAPGQRSVRTALRDLLERLIDQAEGVPIAVRDDDGVECATTGIAGTDPHRQAGHVRVGTADQPNA